jgi:hypothetical protein
MSRVLTPDTALLYSYLDLDPFHSPAPLYRYPKDNDDLSSQAFSILNSRGSEAGLTDDCEAIDERGPHRFTPSRSNSISTSKSYFEDQSTPCPLSPTSVLGDFSDINYSLSLQPQNSQPTIEGIRAIYGSGRKIEKVDGHSSALRYEASHTPSIIHSDSFPSHFSNQSTKLT